MAVIAAASLALPLVPVPTEAQPKDTIATFVGPVLVLYDPKEGKRPVDKVRRTEYAKRKPGDLYVVLGMLPTGALLIQDGTEQYGVRPSHVVTSSDAAAGKDCEKVANAAVDSGANRAFGSGCSR